MRTLICAAAALTLGACGGSSADTCAGAAVHVVANTHGTATGWLTGFGRERNYMVNNYASHLAYGERNAPYAIAFSEVPTAIAMREIAPEAFDSLRRALREGRADLANAFYLETSPDLTQGETLLRMGVESIRWQQAELGRRPDTAWLIDANGVHRQIPEILAQLGVGQFVYGRNPPSDANVHIWRAPSGREALAVFSDSYAHWRPLFTEGASANENAANIAYAELRNYREATPEGFPSLWLIGAADYSPAPAEDRVISANIVRIARTPVGRPCMSTPRAYFRAVRAAQRQAPGALPVYAGESLNSYNLFWFLNPRFKQRYRATESRLLAVEMLAALRSLDGAAYPSVELQHAWTLLFLNSDRALLWGAGADDAFYGAESWSAQDRFAAIDLILDGIESRLREGERPALFHGAGAAGAALNETTIPQGSCDRAPNSAAATCLVRFPDSQLIAVAPEAPALLAPIETPHTVQSGDARVEIDPATGDITGLISPAGVNAIGAPSNVVALERQPPHDRHQDYLAPPATRMEIATRDRGSSRVRAYASPLRTVIESTETMDRGRTTIVRRMSILRDLPRIYVDLSLRGVPDDAIAYTRFALARDMTLEAWGLPYGTAQRDPRAPTPYSRRFLMHDHRTLGLHDAIAPAIRWSAYTNEAGAGFALFDIGAPGRETHGREARLMLLASSTHYRGLPNAWLDAGGETHFRYVIAPIFDGADQAALARTARDINAAVITTADASMPALRVSSNLLVESVRRYDRWLEIRGVEIAGMTGQAEIAAPWPHLRAERTDALGEHGRRLRAQGRGAERRYRVSVLPQEIVTLRFLLGDAVPPTPPLTSYRDLAPPSAAADMQLRDPSLIGHPPQ